MPDNSVVSVLLRGKPEHELAALVVLLQTRPMPNEQLSSVLLESGSAVKVLEHLESEWRLAPAFSGEDIKAAIVRVSEWHARQLDVRPVFSTDYPDNLLTIFNHPPLIFVKGTWDEERDSSSVSVVGTRKASPDGLKRARSAATRLAKAGITVLSGLAAGIDTAAHTAALDAGGRTVAVMGTGLDRIYPKENAALAEQIVSSGGALISQFLPEQPPTRWTFPMRNVVMSGLSLATLVIEASATSGAKSQARHALQHGRTVFLPKPLVEEHPWAHDMVTTGVDGVRAVEIASSDEIVQRLISEPKQPAIAV